MALHRDRADLLIQYALLLAGEEDEPFARQLGPIHLIKYIYLADLAYARRHGETYSSAAWRFHNFGPWDAEVYERVELAASAIHAEQFKFESNFGDDDWVRYRLRDTERLSEIERAVPGAISIVLRNHVHKFLGDTPSLLDCVYRTEPMLVAAPGDYLDFSLVAPPELVSRTGVAELRLGVESSEETAEEDESQLFRKLSKKGRKRFQQRIRELGEKQLTKPRELVNPVRAPRYDEIYEQGVAWLEEIAGAPQLEAGEFTAEFSDDVWKSSTRKGEDVP